MEETDRSEHVLSFVNSLDITWNIDDATWNQYKDISAAELSVFLSVLNSENADRDNRLDEYKAELKNLTDQNNLFSFPEEKRVEFIKRIQRAYSDDLFEWFDISSRISAIDLILRWKSKNPDRNVGPFSDYKFEEKKKGTAHLAVIKIAGELSDGRPSNLYSLRDLFFWAGNILHKSESAVRLYMVQTGCLVKGKQGKTGAGLDATINGILDYGEENESEIL